MTDVLFLDSITDVSEAARGQVVASGSHGGIYPAAIASRAGVRAVAFNDAGVGLEDAGVAGVLALGDVGMAAIAASAMSCHIGSSRDLAARGRVSTCNKIAAALGVEVGMPVAAALELLGDAPIPAGQLPSVEEARQVVCRPSGLSVTLLDSASLVRTEDAGTVVVTGSHGALIGGDPARALKADARVAVFNDAGRGRDDIGVTRLPALDQRGVAAVTVGANTARIGDAASALATGVISEVSETARLLGAAIGQRLSDWLDSLPVVDASS